MAVEMGYSRRGSGALLKRVLGLVLRVLPRIPGARLRFIGDLRGTVPQRAGGVRDSFLKVVDGFHIW